MDFLGEATILRGYGCSAPKKDIPHPRVQETFPENFVEIILQSLFISFYGKFKIFIKEHFICLL